MYSHILIFKKKLYPRTYIVFHSNYVFESMFLIDELTILNNFEVSWSSYTVFLKIFYCAMRAMLKLPSKMV